LIGASSQVTGAAVMQIYRRLW